MDVIPTLRIRLSRGLITVESNETGFEERHVRALCDINHSTKTDRKVTDNDSIGEKGIGKCTFALLEGRLISRFQIGLFRRGSCLLVLQWI